MPSALLWPTATHAHLPVQVRGAAQLEADVRASAGNPDLTIRGRMRDELGAPISSTRLTFEVEARQQQSAVAPISNARSCLGSPEARTGSESSIIETNEDGRFCAQIPQLHLPTGATLRIVFDGSESYAGTTQAITIEDQRAGLEVEVEQLQHRANLDEAEWSIVALLQPIVSTNLQDSLLLPVEVSLTSADDGKTAQRTLLRSQMKVGSPTRITVSTAMLGRPGPAELNFAFGGSEVHRPFLSQFYIERITSVHLTATDWPLRGVAGDRMTTVVRAESGVRLPPPGFVEVLGLDGAPSLFALAPDGTTKVIIAAPRTPTQNTISIRYQSNTPGWQSSAPLRVPVELLPPSRWPTVGWATLALLVVGWFAWSRRRAEPEAESPTPTTSPRPYAHLELIEAADDPHAGWSGSVVDAHDGQSIRGATVELRRPGFGRDEVLFTAVSDQTGQFEIPPQLAESKGNHRLEIRARGYANLGLVLPPPGRAKVFLVTTRRAILERLVSWAKRRGQPFDSGTETTPNWVAEVARAKGHREIEVWANAVSDAAFGSKAPADAESPELLPPSGGIGSWAGVKRND